MEEKTSKSFTVRRLYKDLKELLENPIEGISALPLETNIFEWHANLQATKDSPYKGMILHLILIFPETYPVQPPTIMPCTELSHPNVFGSYICLDMLEKGSWASEEEKNLPYTGWSSAYSISSILRQLQVFLLSNQGKGYGYTPEQCAGFARTFRCKCFHSPSTRVIWPPLNNKLLNSAIEGKLKLLKPKEPIKGLLPKKPIENKIQNPVTSVTSSTIASSPPTASNPPKDSIPIKEKKEKPESKEKVKKPKKDKKIASEPKELPFVLVQSKNRSGTPKNEHRASNSHSSQIIEASNFFDSLKNADAIENVQNNSQNRRHSETKRPPVFRAPVIESRTPNGEAPKASLETKSKNGNQNGNSHPNNLRRHFTTSLIEEEKKEVPKAQLRTQTLQLGPLYKMSFKPQGKPSIQPNGKAGKLEAYVKVNPWMSPSARKELELLRQTEEKAKKEEPKPKVIQISPESNEGNFGIFNLHSMPDEILVSIVSYLVNVKDLSNFSGVCKSFRRIGLDGEIWKNLMKTHFPESKMDSPLALQEWKSHFGAELKLIKSQLQCFHSKLTFEDDVLGIPLVLKLADNRDGKYIAYISSPLDLLSYASFTQESVRKSVWKEQFTHWLPIWINKEHGTRGRQLFRDRVTKLGGTGYFHRDVLQVLPKLMNTMVVNVMDGSVHASIKALEGYCHFHRLFLQCIKEDRQLLATVNKEISDFIQSSKNRDKSKVPSLGEWLPLLTVSTQFEWPHVAKAYLEENFDRNAKWILAKYSTLGSDRIEKSFDAVQVSIKLLMFHVCFLVNVARPKGVSLNTLMENYDLFYGQPSHRMKEYLQQQIFLIQKVSTWPQFFNYIKYPCPTKQKLEEWLIHAQRNSRDKGYHK